MCLLKVLWLTLQGVAAGYLLNKNYHNNVSEQYHLYADIFNTT